MDLGKTKDFQATAAFRNSVRKKSEKKGLNMRRYKKCHIVDIVLDNEHQVRITRFSFSRDLKLFSLKYFVAI